MYGQSTGLILEVVVINLYSMNMYTIGVDVHMVGTQTHMTGYTQEI